MNNVHNVVVVEQQREPANFGFVAALLLAGMVALLVQYFWHIVIVVGLILTVAVVHLLVQDHRLRAREVALRADEQNRLFLQGDPRGVYGDGHEGFEQR